MAGRYARQVDRPGDGGPVDACPPGSGYGTRMRGPEAPYPGADDQPDGPAWVGLLPYRRPVVDESTTQVPVLTDRRTGEVEVETQPERPEQPARPEAAQPRPEGTPAHPEPGTPHPEAAASHEAGPRPEPAPRQPGVVPPRPEAAAPHPVPPPADAPSPRPAVARPGPGPDASAGVPGWPAPAARTAAANGTASAQTERRAGHRPGEVPHRPITLWDPETVQRLRDRWREVQSGFVDDPQAAVAEAERLVTEVVRVVSERLQAEVDGFDPYRSAAEPPDTEQLRVAMRRYREFLDRLLAL